MIESSSNLVLDLRPQQSCSPFGPTACPSDVQQSCHRAPYGSNAQTENAQTSAVIIPVPTQQPAVTSLSIQPLATLNSVAAGHLQAELQQSTSAVKDCRPTKDLEQPRAVAEDRPFSATTAHSHSPHTIQAAPLRQQDVLSYALSMALNSPSQGQLASPMKIISKRAIFHDFVCAT